LYQVAFKLKRMNFQSTCILPWLKYASTPQSNCLVFLARLSVNLSLACIEFHLPIMKSFLTLHVSLTYFIYKNSKIMTETQN